MVSVNRLERRVSDFEVHDWILDSGAFTRITSGKGHMPMLDYAAQINRWSHCGNLLAAVCQDYMCEPFVLGITGLTVRQHQSLTVSNYRALAPMTSTYVMPVLQGYQPSEYVDCLRLYGDLALGAWVGVGSVCKRNAHVEQVVPILEAINSERPDLKLHGFGLKQTALLSHAVNDLLYSCDSMAWSYAARREGRNANSPDEAIAWSQRIATLPVQLGMRQPVRTGTPALW